MASQLIPVDNDPFSKPANAASSKLVPVEHDPFQKNAAPQAPTQPQTAAPSVMDNVGRQLGLTARYGAEGLMSLPNLIGDAANASVNLGSSLINKAAGTAIPAIPSMSSVVEGGLNKVLPQPETTVEKIVAEPSKFVASLPSFGIPAAASKLEELKPLAEKYLNQAIGALTGGTALGVTKEALPDNKPAQLAATIAAATLGGKASAAAMGEAAPAEVRSVQQVKNAASAAYKAADDAGVIIKPETMENFSNGLKQDLAEFGYHPQMQPKIATVLGELDRVNGQNITSKQVQIIRRMANNARLSTDASERTLGGTIVNKLDNMMETIGPNDIVQGDAPAAAAGLKEGAQLWKQFRKAQEVDTATAKGDLNAASSGSGGNLANATRQQIKAILANPKKVSSYTADEVDQMNKIVRGGALTNALRLIGKLSPSTGALPLSFSSGVAGAGLATGHPLLGVMLPAIGYGAKRASDALTLGGVNDLSELIRAGGTKALVQAAKNPARNVAPDQQLNGDATNYLRLLLQSYGLNNGDTLPSPSAGLLSAPIGIAGQNTQGRRR